MQDIVSPYDQCTEWFRRVEERYQNDLGGLNALIDRETNEFIGQCGLLVQIVDEKKELEIGYSVLPKYWNLGYATEAAIKCRDFAFQNNFTESLISIIHVDNIKSERVALKVGMVKVRQTIFKDLKVNIFAIAKSTWSKKIIKNGSC